MNTYSVYLIRSGNTDYYKIGIAICPETRGVALQCGNPKKLSVIYAKELAFRRKAHQLEVVAQNKFEKYHIHGEWFDLTEALCRDVIDFLENHVVKKMPFDNYPRVGTKEMSRAKLERNKEMLNMYMDERMTLEEIAIENGISRQRVQQVLSQFKEYKAYRT